MTTLAVERQSATGGRRAASDGPPEWARVVLMAAAFACGALGYWHYFDDSFPPWRWLGDLAVGWVLLIIALPQSRTPESAARRWSRRAAAAIAVGAAAVAVHWFPQAGRELRTGVAIVVAVVAFLLFRWVPFRPQDVHELTGDLGPGPRHPPLSFARIGMALAALAAAVVAAVINEQQHLPGFVLWLASLILFAAAWWERPRREVDEDDAGWRGEGGPRLSRATIAVAFTLILVLALALRVLMLDQVQFVIDADEGRQGRHAERIWKDGFPNAFDLGWNVFPHLSYMVEYAGVQLLGTSNASLRFSAAVIGTLSIIPLFLWARRWWGDLIGLLAAGIVAINREHIWWSRIALNNIQQVLVAALMLAAFARLLRRQRWIDWVWLGYATGLAFHTYHAAKLFPALLAACGLLFALGIPRFARRLAGGAAVGALAFVLCCGPLLVTMYQRWEQFYAGTSNRSDLATLFAAYERGDIAGVRNYLNSHVRGCLYSFFAVPRPQDASLDPFLAVIFLLGAGWVLWYWRDPRHLVVVVWTAGILVIGGMITDYPPWKARMIGFLPTVCVIPAVLAGRFRDSLYRLGRGYGDIVAFPVIFVWLLAALHYSWRTEFVLRPQWQRYDVMTEMYRVIKRTRLPATFYLASGGEVPELAVTLNDCMVAPDPDRHLVNLSDDPAIVPIPPSNQGTAVLFVTVYQQELLPLIRHYYPDARYEVVYDFNTGAPALHSFTLTEQDIERRRGLRATYRDTARTWTSAMPSTQFVVPTDAKLPLDVTWRGLIRIPAPGAYGFRSDGGTIRIDEAPLPESGGTVKLAAGWHAIALSATFIRPNERASLEWKLPDATDWESVPQAALHAHPERHGLLGRFFDRALALGSPQPTDGAAGYTRLDTALSFDWEKMWDQPPPEPFAARPSTMEWTGTVELPEGDAALRLESTTPAEVFIDGVRVLSTAGARGAPPVDVQLPGVRGRVPILVRAVRPAEDDWRYWKLRLLWSQPGGGWTAFAPYEPAVQLNAAAARGG